jgi:hypothetical protein
MDDRRGQPKLRAVSRMERTSEAERNQQEARATLDNYFGSTACKFIGLSLREGIRKYARSPPARLHS